MTSVLKNDDKIFTMYKQYKDLLDKIHTLEKNGKSQIAAQLTVAHMLDHAVCLMKKEDEEPIRVIEVNNTWKEKFGNRPLVD
tara:strand:+ start:167 stop:412 length:246 start_codon:yes stop_codon:yes gene_type:complete